MTNKKLQRPDNLKSLSDEEIDRIHDQAVRETRRLKIGGFVLGGIMLAAVFSAVGQISSLESEPVPESPAIEETAPSPQP